MLLGEKKRGGVRARDRVGIGAGADGWGAFQHKLISCPIYYRTIARVSIIVPAVVAMTFLGFG